MTLNVLVGKSPEGKDVCVNIDKAPHILIAGATGSGKSVLLNSILCRLMMSYTPENFKLLLIDLKRVELVSYKDTKYLLKEPALDFDVAVKYLEEINKTIDERFKVLEKRRLKNWDSMKEPRIIVVIDELSNLMMSDAKTPDLKKTLPGKKVVEPLIARIAMIGRAAGVHLIVCTQYPLSQIISPTLKANIPTRIGLQTASGVNSRVIIDKLGCETLKGKGDCFVKLSSQVELIRCQVPFISDEAIEKVCDSWRIEKEPQEDNTLSKINYVKPKRLKDFWKNIIKKGENKD